LWFCAIRVGKMHLIATYGMDDGGGKEKAVTWEMIATYGNG